MRNFFYYVVISDFEYGISADIVILIKIYFLSLKTFQGHDGNIFILFCEVIRCTDRLIICVNLLKLCYKLGSINSKLVNWDNYSLIGGNFTLIYTNLNKKGVIGI